MDYVEKARALRADPAVHYNCCQAVLVTFADRLGLTPEQANALGAHFGSGMRHGSTCGAVSGALMVLGLLGCDEKQSTALLRDFRTRHGALDCADLLRASKERGRAAQGPLRQLGPGDVSISGGTAQGSRAPDPDRGVGGDCQVPRPLLCFIHQRLQLLPGQLALFDLRPAGDLSLQFLPCNIPEDIFDPQVGWQDILNDLPDLLKSLWDAWNIREGDRHLSRDLLLLHMGMDAAPGDGGVDGLRVKLSPPIRISAARAFRIPVGVSATGRRASRAMIRSSPQLSAPASVLSRRSSASQVSTPSSAPPWTFSSRR